MPAFSAPREANGETRRARRFAMEIARGRGQACADAAHTPRQTTTSLEQKQPLARPGGCALRSVHPRNWKKLARFATATARTSGGPRLSITIDHGHALFPLSLKK